MRDNEDGTGSPTPSSFSIQIPILTSNNSRRDFKNQNSKIFYIKISLTILVLISYLIFILHTIMTAADYKFLIEDKFKDLDYSFNYYCNQGLTPEEAFNEACKDNGINNWL